MLVHPRNHWRLTFAVIAAIVAMAWVIALCFWPASAEPALLILNGLLVGVYGSGFGIAHPDSRGPACITLCWVLGLTHPLWLILVVVASEVVCLVIPSARSAHLNDAGLFIGTGLVFALALGIATRSMQAAIPMLVGTVASGGIVMLGLASTFRSLGVACAPLHLGIAAGLACSAWTALRNKWPAGICQYCHYDLRGNTTGLCPECGTPTTKHLAPKPLGGA